MAFDSSKRKMRFYSVSSTGAVRDHVGRWTGDDTLEFEWSGLREGKIVSDKILVKWSSSSEITTNETLKSENQILQLLRLKMKKGKISPSIIETRALLLMSAN